MPDKSLMEHFKAVAKHTPKKRRRLRRTHVLSTSSFPIETEEVNLQRKLTIYQNAQWRFISSTVFAICTTSNKDNSTICPQSAPRWFTCFQGWTTAIFLKRLIDCYLLCRCTLSPVKWVCKLNVYMQCGLISVFLSSDVSPYKYLKHTHAHTHTHTHTHSHI